MNDKIFLTVLTAALNWKCPGHLYGTGALMVCAARAIEREQRGEPWSAFRVCQEYAAEKGKVQHSVWVSICYALERSSGPRNPAEAIAAIVKGAKENGTITRG